MKPRATPARRFWKDARLGAAVAWLVALLAIPAVSSAATWTSPPEEIAALTRKPLLVLYEHDPWMFIVGADQVSFAIYEDGLVIFRRQAEQMMTTFEAQLPPERAVELATTWTDELRGAPDYFAVETAHDQSTAVMLFRQEREWSMRSAYGFERNDQRIAIPPEHRPAYRQLVQTLPERRALTISEQRFRDVYAELVAFDPDDERVWRPEQLELLFADLGTDGPGFPWPAALPPLPASLVDHPGGRVAKHLVPAASEPRIDALRSQLRGRAIRHAGRNWRVSVRQYAPDERTVQKVMSNLER